jgi:dTDP-4-amino-4,6-dideoxygalactose transaminase
MNEPDDYAAPVPFALPDLTEREIEAVTEVLRSRWLTTGPRTREFETEFAAAVGAPYAVALNSATAALHLSLEAFGLSPGDLVFLPSYTFASSGEVVRYFGARPVFVEVEPGTANLDPIALRKAVLESFHLGRARAIMPVHIAGVPCDMSEIWDIAREFELAVVEDAAHAFPAHRDGRIVGSIPEDVQGAVCFSFYATKTITTGEGGMVVSRDEQVAERIRTMSLHGLSRQAWNRYSGGTWRYDIIAPGYKYNLTDMAAALGVVQLKRAEEMATARRHIAERYLDELGDLAAFELPQPPDGVESAWHLFVLRVDGSSGELERDRVIDSLKRQGIGTSVHFIPLHLHSYYRETLGHRPEDFPVTLDLYRRAVSLPIWSAMSGSQVDRVVSAVRRAALEVS